MILQPIQTGFGDEPTGKDSESEMVFPGTVFDRLKLIPTEFRFGILDSPFDKITLRLAPAICSSGVSKGALVKV